MSRYCGATSGFSRVGFCFQSNQTESSLRLATTGSLLVRSYSELESFPVMAISIVCAAVLAMMPIANRLSLSRHFKPSRLVCWKNAP